MTEIVRVDGLAGYRGLVAELGGDGDAMLRDVGIDPAILDVRDAYLPFRKLWLAFERAALVLKRPDFGMRLALSRNPEVLGPLTIAMQNAETGREGFACAQRYMHFHNTALRVAVEAVPPDAEFVCMNIELRRPPAGVQAQERIVAAANQMMRLFAGAAYRPREVWFRHQACAPLEAYRRLFDVTPRFGAPDNGLMVARDQLDQRLSSANPQLKALALHFLEGKAASADEPLASRARSLVGRLLRSGECGQSDLAEALGLHERTLQRRLKEEHTSFEAIRDEVRRDIAQSYLAQKNVPLSHVAEVLGYAEASAFTRACRRWFGESPRAMRKKVAASV